MVSLRGHVAAGVSQGVPGTVLMRKQSIGIRASLTGGPFPSWSACTSLACTYTRSLRGILSLQTHITGASQTLQRTHTPTVHPWPRGFTLC